jgi:5-methylcytosine-specific restriction endonuclease McrA
MNREEIKLINYQSTHKDIDGVLYKKCSIHKEYFPNDVEEWFPCTDEYFYKHNTSSDGLFPYCKRCNIRKRVKYQRENKEKIRAYNKENIKKESVRERRRGYVKDRRYSEKYKEWAHNNPEKIKEYRLNREQNKTHKISTKEWTGCKDYFNNECAYCGLPIDKHYNRFAGEIKLTDFHREHVNHEGANDLSNCVPSCKSCNSSKGTYILEEWYIKQKFYSEEKLNKIYKWLNEDYKLYIK